MKGLKPLLISGKEVLPLVEGGKGIAVSNGQSSGAWAAAGGVGTFSGVNADSYDADGNILDQVYHSKTRRGRHEELIAYGIQGGIAQARIAHEMSNGEGRLHVNVLWEMGGAEEILHGILEGAPGLVHGVTCGAGMPYKVAEIAAKFGVYYYPIVSSARAFRALWLRAFNKFPNLLGGVVYEDPWLAGGHNGLSNSEDPQKPEDPYPRVAALRQMMNSFGLTETPVIMAGGVWWLSEWEHWLDNPEIGPVAFQFGTRPLLTQESPISEAWKQRLLTLKAGDVFLNRFSPTGFYSSAVRNPFLENLRQRSERQIAFSVEPVGELTDELALGPRGRPVYVTKADKDHAEGWMSQGFTTGLKTPDNTLVFVTPDESRRILKDQVDCMGCLSACAFSNWSQNEEGTTGRRADPRSFCIQKTLQNISHSEDVENQLMFAGHNAYRFASDPWYKDGFVPTVKQLVDRIASGY
ncbi:MULTISPECIES: nitronate monooxygenase [unclassified Azospirillum]|uniref:NAD(P)H-dependent flavin oxidoreductase n=1 Tax=Azospirillaceae TaxID=2829815 RepID=UPI000B6BF320|nr:MULTISPECIES: nitronate monooxygenase [unclassified Azospirillum]MDG5495881.1 nitronate monooxygenase [Niveispirillum sp. BGYR6]SNS64810.1 NAD(P)H-dependent flavin oxidoreductase YrpB, nitropropane dioxygenase family [Azospirillum sp. RU38E]SNS83721.1 NAD(P)H-dependent flavin oxidoreductase YrpB, nitropropane dioxygenase family [Azospirillum sp. RU37A]